MPRLKLSDIDVRILRILQDNSHLPNQELASKVGLASSPCWRRVQKLEESHVIRGYRAILDRRMLDLNVLVFVRVRIGHHSEEEARRFEREIGALERVIACYSIGGDADFLLQVVARDLDDFSDFALKTIRNLPGIKEMQSMFVLRELKAFTGFPISTALQSVKAGTQKTSLKDCH